MSLRFFFDISGKMTLSETVALYPRPRREQGSDPMRIDCGQISPMAGFIVAVTIMSLGSSVGEDSGVDLSLPFATAFDIAALYALLKNITAK